MLSKIQASAILLILISCLSTVSHASDFDLTADATGNADFSADAGKTKFQTLLDAYTSATQPASLDYFKQKQLNRCVTVTEQTPDQLGSTLFKVACSNVLSPAVEAHYVPATASAGPLFPSKPAYMDPGHAEICAPNGEVVIVGGEWIQTITPEKLKVFSNEMTPSDFAIHVAANDQGVYSDIGQNVQILVRHKENYYPFVVKTSKGMPVVGYCY